jgi:hypothetical protein
MRYEYTPFYFDHGSSDMEHQRDRLENLDRYGHDGYQIVAVTTHDTLDVLWLCRTIEEE